MGSTIQVVTDSSCDLTQQLIERYEIGIVPLIIRFGSETYKDGDLSMEEFWEKAAGAHPPQTSQPPVGAFEDLFEQLVAQGKQALCLTLTGKHSGTFNAACLAAQDFGGMVEVFDSQSLSLGLGLQVWKAAQAAEAGRSMEEILALLEDLRAQIRLLIVLDTLESLRRGGRADGFIALVDRMTQALNIKPIVNMVEGQLGLVGVARSFQGALKRALDLIERMGPLEYLAVVHARREETAKWMVGRLAKRTGLPCEEISIQETGAVLASHGGYGVLGVVAQPVHSPA